MAKSTCWREREEIYLLRELVVMELKEKEDDETTMRVCYANSLALLLLLPTELICRSEQCSSSNSSMLLQNLIAQQN